jgi:hypothetical protein
MYMVLSNVYIVYVFGFDQPYIWGS